MYDLSIPGFMTESELIQIEKWAREVPNNGIIVEAGSHKGRSAVCWAQSCDPTVTVYCIDTYATPTPNSTSFYNEFVANTKHLNNIVPVKALVPYSMHHFKKNIDIFFLDLTHQNPHDIDTLKFFLPMINKNGLLCGHDYKEDEWPAVIENIKWLEDTLKQEVTLYPGTTLWSFRI